MIPATMIAPEVMMTLPRFSGLAHSDCQVGMAVEISKLKFEVYRDLRLDLLDVTIPFPIPPTTLPTINTPYPPAFPPFTPPAAT